MRPTFTEEIKFFCPNDFFRLKLLQDKAASHASKRATAFLEKIKTYKSIGYVLFQYIPANSLDLSPTDYCTFSLLKRSLSKSNPTTIDGITVEKD